MSTPEPTIRITYNQRSSDRVPCPVCLHDEAIKTATIGKLTGYKCLHCGQAYCIQRSTSERG